jgi:hypothetical protein
MSASRRTTILAVVFDANLANNLSRRGKRVKSENLRAIRTSDASILAHQAQGLHPLGESAYRFSHFTSGTPAK